MCLCLIFYCVFIQIIYNLSACVLAEKVFKRAQYPAISIGGQTCPIVRVKQCAK